MKTATSLDEQKALVLSVIKSGYVGLLFRDWTWYVSKKLTSIAAARQWWDNLRCPARVYKVSNGVATLIMAR